MSAHIGPVLTFESLQQAVAKVPRTEQNREAARLVEVAVRKLAPEGPNRKMPTDSVGAVGITEPHTTSRLGPCAPVAALEFTFSFAPFFSP